MQKLLNEWRTFIIEADAKFNYQDEVEKGDLSDLGVAYHLWTYGFKEKKYLIEAVHIVLGESEGRFNATNKNRNGSTDYGIWQFNNFAHFKGDLGYKKRVAGIKKRFDGFRNKTKNKKVIEKLNRQQEKAIEKLTVSGKIPWISEEIARDPIRSTQHALIVFNDSKRRRGESGRWTSWVRNADTDLIKKYGSKKRDRAEAAVEKLFKFPNL